MIQQFRPYTEQDAVAFYKSKYANIAYSLESVGDVFNKADGTIVSTMGEGFNNQYYGMNVFRQFNMETNAWAVIPKTTWDRSGVRQQDSLSASSSDLPNGQSDTLTADKYADILTVDFTPKNSILPFSISSVQQNLAEKSKDDIYGGMAQRKILMGEEYIKLVNKQLLQQVMPSPSGTYTKNANAITALDNIVASNDEQTALSLPAGQEDVYGIDRSTRTNSQSYVSYSATGQDLTIELLRNTYLEAITRGATPNICLTGLDTYGKISSLFQSFERLATFTNRGDPMAGIGRADATVGLGGIKPIAQGAPNEVQHINGISSGITVSVLFNGLPIITAVDTPSDTDKLSRIYMLDTTPDKWNREHKLSLSILNPTQYFEADNVAYLNKPIVRGVYLMQSELTAKFLYGQAKIRDINL